MFTGMFGFFAKDKVDNSYSNNGQKKSNLSLSYGGGKINHNYSINSSAWTAKYHAIIALTKFSVNTSESLVTSIAASQTTTKFEHIAEKTFNCALLIVNELCINTQRIRILAINQYV